METHQIQFDSNFGDMFVTTNVWPKFEERLTIQWQWCEVLQTTTTKKRFYVTRRLDTLTNKLAATNTIRLSIPSFFLSYSHKNINFKTGKKKISAHASEINTTEIPKLLSRKYPGDNNNHQAHRKGGKQPRRGIPPHTQHNHQGRLRYRRCNLKNTKE